MSPFRILALYLSLLTPNVERLEFTRVQEEWVAQTLVWPEKAAAGLPPVYYSLSHPEWRIRRIAHETVGLLGAAQAPSLFRAQYHRDPEVRHRTEVLLKRLYRCGYCRGSGMCQKCVDNEDPPRCGCDYLNHCTACKGSGDSRYGVDRRLVGIEYRDTLHPKEIFPRLQNATQKPKP